MDDQNTCSTGGGCPTCRPCRASWILLAALAGLLIYNVVTHVRGRSAGLVAPAERQAVSDLSMPDLDGKIWSLDEHRGRVVLVNFWATWCPPCREETPDLVRISKRYGEKGVSVIGVALDQSGEEPVRQFVRKYEMPYPVLIPQQLSPLLESVSSIPVTLLVDRQGRIARRYDGPVTESQLAADLDRLLAEEAPVAASF